jgi:predicted  nucleic acid-binding Zn-ribbon protein
VSDLDTLLELQGRDLALDRLRHERATLPERERLRGLAEQAAALTARRAGQQTERDDVARLEQRFADEAAQLVEQIGGAERRLYSGEIASPRELQALQADVEQLRRHQRTVEDRELNAMERREPLDQDLKVLNTEHEAVQAEARGVAADLQTRERDLDAALAVEHAARDELASELGAGVVVDYERRRAQGNGVGVARLVGSTCQGCHLTIPATEVDRIRRQPDGTHAYCDNCGAILVP